MKPEDPSLPAAALILAAALVTSLVASKSRLFLRGTSSASASHHPSGVSAHNRRPKEGVTADGINDNMSQQVISQGGSIGEVSRGASHANQLGDPAPNPTSSIFDSAGGGSQQQGSESVEEETVGGYRKE